MTVQFCTDKIRFPPSGSEKVVLSVITLTALAAISFGLYGFIQGRFLNTLRIATVASGGAALAVVLARLSCICFPKSQLEGGPVQPSESLADEGSLLTSAQTSTNPGLPLPPGLSVRPLRNPTLH